jgi:Ni,Fe-hydrogenase III small subunit
MIKQLKMIFQNGRQYIPNLRDTSAPPSFRGRPKISGAKIDENSLVELCPTRAISHQPLRIDLGKCAFCGECSHEFPEKVTFTNSHKMYSNCREQLIVSEGDSSKIEVVSSRIRSDIKRLFGRSLKLRHISAACDNSCGFELGACSNANFDMGRYGIEITPSPRHADGIIITGPISSSIHEALEITYKAIPKPKLIILCGTDAISGGLFESSSACDRTFLDTVHIDLYIPGNPPHPLAIINGILDLTRSDRNKGWIFSRIRLRRYLNFFSPDIQSL